MYALPMLVALLRSVHTKVEATFPLTRRTLVQKVCRVGGANSFTNFGKHSRWNHSATVLVARVHPDQSHGSA